VRAAKVSSGMPSTADARATRATIRVPTTRQCGLLICVARLALKACGFPRTVAWIRGRVAGVPVAAAPDIAIVRQVEHNVALAAGFYPGRAKCLEQSLVLYYVLRCQGVKVQYCQGVQPYPFSAHAWVEYRNEVINDVEEHVKHFARFPDPLP
jgi:hypothetical protein